MPVAPLRLLATSAVVLALALAPAQAHESWAERVLLIQFGEPDEDVRDAYKPEQIKELSAIAADGSAVAVRALPVGDVSVLVKHSGPVDPAAVFYTMQLSHYIITDGKRAKATAEEAAKAEKTWTGSYTVTSVLTWHPSLATPRSRSIELVPLTDPLTATVGEPLALRAYRDGKPLAGLTINLGKDVKPAVSDADGNLAVPVHAGLQVILGRLNQVDGGHTTGHLAVLSFTHP